MTHRERILAAMAMKPVDRIPWAPRMDLWYVANRAKGTVPKRFEGMNTVEIARELGYACHLLRADYTLPRRKEDLILRGFGIDNHPDYPYRVELHDLDYDFVVEDEDLIFTAQTTAGEVKTHIRLSREMLKTGITLPFVERYPIESVDDLERVAIIFDHLKIVRTPEQYRQCKERIGDDGVAVANGMPVASPIHFLLHDLMPMDTFYFMYVDAFDQLQALSDRMTPFFEGALDAAIDCDCEAVFWGGNYDDTTTYKPFFVQEIVPWLRKVRARTEAKGKISVSHTDGENLGLLDVLPDCGMHVAESFCPDPMTKVTLKMYRDALGRKSAVWGGIPAVALLPDSMSDRVFRDYLDRVFGELGNGLGLILGVSDNVPPEADLTRLEVIARKIEDFGPVTA